MTAGAIRCSNDLKLSKALLARQEIKRLNRSIKRKSEKGEQSATRRHLLATSVRLSPGMAAAVHQKAERCVERLGIDNPLELYAYASPQFNAACFKPEEGRVLSCSHPACWKPSMTQNCCLSWDMNSATMSMTIIGFQSAMY